MRSKAPKRRGLPPASRWRIGANPQTRPAANLHLLAIDDRPEPRQLAVEHLSPARFAVFVDQKKLLRRAVRVQNARHFAAAVKTQVKGIKSLAAAGHDGCGSPALQIFLAAAQQFVGDDRQGVGDAEHQHADHADLQRQAKLVGRRTEAGMHETQRLAVVDSQDQAEAIENRLRQHERFEQRRRHRLHQSALAGLAAPDFGQ